MNGMTMIEAFIKGLSAENQSVEQEVKEAV
jgi:hypothetical protein